MCAADPLFDGAEGFKNESTLSTRLLNHRSFLSLSLSYRYCIGYEESPVFFADCVVMLCTALLRIPHPILVYPHNPFLRGHILQSRRLRPQQGLCLASRWSGVNSSGKKMNSVSSMGSTTNTATSFAAATGELKGEQQQQKQLKRPAKDFLPYAEESLNAALLDEQNKRLVWEASKPAEGAAQLRCVRGF